MRQRWLWVAVLAATGCRQALGIPGEGVVDEGGTARFDVSVMATGIAGASAAVSLHIARSDGTADDLPVPDDGALAFSVADGVAYTVTAPTTCTVENETGTIMGASPALAVILTCDGLASLVEPGFSAPIQSSAASTGTGGSLLASFLVQETRVTPVLRHSTATVTLALDGTQQTGSNGTWGPFPLATGMTFELATSHPPAFAQSYAFTVADADAAPAPFGYGKPATPLAGSRFGSAIATDGELLVVGAPGPADGSGSGHVYVFRRAGSQWSEEAVLQAPTAAIGDRFGAAVALRGSRLVVGSPRGGAMAGTAYVFSRDSQGSWSGVELAAASGDRLGLGSAVVLDDTHLLVGAPDAATGTGAVFQYDLDGTNPVLFGAGLDPGDRFGASIAASNGTIVIGAPGEASTGSSPADNGYPGAGAAYVFTGGLGSTPVYLKAAAPAAGDAFGASVATNGPVVVVGAPNQDSSAPVSTGIDPSGTVAGGAPQSGAAFMWRRVSSSWTFAHTLKAPTTSAGDGFGSSLAFLREVLVIGAPFEDASKRDAGAAYAFHLVLDDVGGMPASITAATAGVDDAFGSSLALSPECLVVGAPYDSSSATGWNGQGGDDGVDRGAVAAFR